ncbi:hypothetical protein MMC07_006131 [Pseudocyphellaria aurata]|nr:hypothetical protein [Pseudocyphellaria aurata]
MAPSTSRKRKLEAAIKDKPSRPVKKFRKQPRYTSSSPSSAADEFSSTELASPKSSTSPIPPRTSSPTPNISSPASNQSSASESASSDSSATHGKRTRKRNDPAAFSTSISKILSSKLAVSKRADPVLARSATAALANSELANARLEAKARRKMRADRKLELEKGRVKDVLLGTDLVGEAGLGEGSVGEMVEQERRLRKTAQRGVVKLFNAVRAAQVKGEEAAKEGGAPGRKKERVTEMTKAGFLELVAGGGETTGTGTIKGKAKKVMIEES